jgi:hypothetical protein
MLIKYRIGIIVNTHNMLLQLAKCQFGSNNMTIALVIYTFITYVSQDVVVFLPIAQRKKQLSFQAFNETFNPDHLPLHTRK